MKKKMKMKRNTIYIKHKRGKKKSNKKKKLEVPSIFTLNKRGGGILANRKQGIRSET